MPAEAAAPAVASPPRVAALHQGKLLQVLVVSFGVAVIIGYTMVVGRAARRCVGECP